MRRRDWFAFWITMALMLGLIALGPWVVYLNHPDLFSR